MQIRCIWESPEGQCKVNEGVNETVIKSAQKVLIIVEVIHTKFYICVFTFCRPHWNITTTPEELAQAERDGFLEWRRSLVQLQEVEGLTLTPFEKNLEFWRQLWRVIERRYVSLMAHRWQIDTETIFGCKCTVSVCFWFLLT